MSSFYRGKRRSRRFLAHLKRVIVWRYWFRLQARYDLEVAERTHGKKIMREVSQLAVV